MPIRHERRQGGNGLLRPRILNEYLGRNVMEDDDLVEEVFANEAPALPAFRRQLARLSTEQGLEPATESPLDGGQGGQIVFRSRSIADRINSCFRYQMTNGSATQAPDGSYRRYGKAQAPLSYVFFVNHRRRALAYIAGAWIRYGQEGTFQFANSLDKATLIAHLLTDVGCLPVSLETIFGYIPSTNILRFTPTTELRESLAKPW